MSHFILLRDTKPDVGLIKNLWVSSTGCLLSLSITIFVLRFIYWSDPTLGIIFMLENSKLQDMQMQTGTASQLF